MNVYVERVEHPFSEKRMSHTSAELPEVGQLVEIEGRTYQVIDVQWIGAYDYEVTVTDR